MDSSQTLSPSDRAFLEGLFREAHGRLLTHALRLAYDPQMAEDAVQDTYLTAIDKLPQLRESPNPAGWLYGVLCHQIAHQNRSWAQLVLKVTSLEDAAPLQAAPVEVCDMPSSSGGDMALLTRHYLDGIPLEDLARQAGCSYDAMKMRLFRARERLKKEIKTDTQQEGGA